MNDYKERPLYAKVILLGNKRAGKTTLLKRFVNGTFDPSTQETIEESYLTKDVFVKGSTKTKRFITLQICDPKRAERGDTINAAYYGDAKAVIYVGALDDDKLEENLKFNEEDTESKIDKTAYRFYVGSKKDVFDKETKEKNNMLSDVAGKLEQTYKERFYRVSSKTGEGVDTLFKDVAEAIAKSFPGKIRRKRSAKKSKSWCPLM